LRRREGLAWALLGVATFSFSVPLTKEAVGGFDPFLTATGRAVIAGAMAAVSPPSAARGCRSARS
jgi:drug/metabolite transporter (DMT)-like permease